MGFLPEYKEGRIPVMLHLDSRPAGARIPTDTLGPVIGTIGLIVGAVGAGLQYSALMSAARTQRQFALLNAQAGVQQATQQANMAALQSQLHSTQADTARRAAEDSATAIRSQVETERAVAQENIRRDCDEFARKLAATRAQAGGSGVDVTAGSPLDLLLKASEDEDLLAAEQHWHAGTRRDLGFRQAAAPVIDICCPVRAPVALECL